MTTHFEVLIEPSIWMGIAWVAAVLICAAIALWHKFEGEDDEGYVYDAVAIFGKGVAIVSAVAVILWFIVSLITYYPKGPE